MDEAGQKVLIFNYKINNEDVMYSMLTMLNNTVLCI